jgi:hypothetical protein
MNLHTERWKEEQDNNDEEHLSHAIHEIHSGKTESEGNSINKE